MVITTASMYKSLGEALAMESSHPPKIKEAYTQYLCCIEMLIDNMKTLATTDDTNFSLSIDKMYYFIRECTQRSEQLLLSHPHLFKQQQQQQQQLSSAAAIPPSSSSLSYIITSPRSTQSDHQISQYKQQQQQQQHATNKINSPSNGTFLISDTCSTLTHNHNYNNSNDMDMNNSYYINAGDQQQQHMVPTTTMKQKNSTYSPSDHQGMYPNINNQSQYIAEYFPNNQSQQSQQQQQQQQQFTNHPTIFDSSAPSVPFLLPSSSSLSSSYHTTNHSSIHNQTNNNQTYSNNNTKNGDHMLLYHDELPWSYTPTSHTVNHTTVPSTSTIALTNNRNSLQSSSSSAPPPPIPHSLLFNQQQSKQQQQQSSHYYHPHHQHIAKNEIEHWKQTFQKYQSKSRSLTRIINHQSFSSLLSLLSLVPLSSSSSSSSSLAIPSTTNHHHHHHHIMNHQRNNMVPYTSIPSLLYHSFDMNRSNEMEYEDWSQSMYVLLHGSHKDQIQFSYSMFDPNGIGYISKSMFIHTMTMMYELLNHMGIDLLMMMMTMNMKNKKTTTTTNSASTTSSLGNVPNALLYDESSPQASPSSFIAMIEYRMSQLFDSLFLSSSSSVSVSSSSSSSSQQQQNVTRNQFMNIMMNNENRFRLSTLDLFPLHQKNELNHHHHMDASSSMSPLIHRVQRQFYRSGSPVIPGSPSFDKVLNMMLGIRIAQQQITQMWNMRLYGGTLMSHPNNHNHNNNSNNNNNENRIMKLYARDCNYIMSFELPRVMATSNNSSSHSRSSNSSSSMMMAMDSLFMDQSNPPVQQTPLDDQHDQQTNSQRSSKNFVFKDYAPLVFRSIRSRFGVSEDEYAMALAPEQLLGNLLVGRLTTLTEKITDGKSGNFFFYSHNGQYLCKTISAGELETFLRILPKYYNHMCRYKDTLITRYYGLHCLNDTVFVVMGSVLQTSYKMDCVFDLKGSTVGRSAFTNAEECVKADSEKLKSKILKDLDWIALQKKLTLGEVSGKFLHQLTIDTKLLEECEIIDYSLLVGMRKLPRVLPPHTIDETSSLPFHQQFEGGILFGDTVLYLGIIDTLIEYGVKKKVEHNIKSLYYGDGTGISVTDPKNYATRFLAFLHTQVPGDLSTIYY